MLKKLKSWLGTLINLLINDHGGRVSSKTADKCVHLQESGEKRRLKEKESSKVEFEAKV